MGESQLLNGFLELNLPLSLTYFGLGHKQKMKVSYVKSLRVC